MHKNTNISDLSISEAEAELKSLSSALNKANHAYHTADTPIVSDAEYDPVSYTPLPLPTTPHVQDSVRLRRKTNKRGQIGLQASQF